LVGVTTTAAVDQTTSFPKGQVILLGYLSGIQLADPAIASIALVDVSKTFGMTTAVAALAASISTLALAATVLIGGMLGDRMGRRKVLYIALGVTIAGDVIAAAAPGVGFYMVGRALAGIGVGWLLASSYSMVREVSPPKSVPAALGIWNLTLLMVMLVATIVGGLLVDASWRVALLFTPLLCLIGLPMVIKMLPETKKVVKKVDYWGLIVIGVATVLFLYGFSQAAKSLTTPTFWGPVLAGVVGFALFLWIESKAESPVIPFKLFTRGVFIAAIVSGVAWNLAQAIMQLAASNWWQYVTGLKAFEVALLEVPILLIFGGVGVWSGIQIGKRPGSVAKVMGLGFALMTAGFLLCMLAGADKSALWILPGLFVMSAGIGCTSVPQAALFVKEAPAKFFGTVTSFRTTVGQVGYSLGFTGTIVLVQAFYGGRFAELLSEAGFSPDQTGDAVAAVSWYVQHEEQMPTGPLAAQAIEAAQRAYSTGFDSLMFIIAIVMAVFGVATLLFLRWGRKQDERDAAATAAAGNAGE